MTEERDFPSEGVFVSTGSLPTFEYVNQAVADAFNLYRNVDDGEVSDVFPALSAVDPSLFGISLVSSRGVHWKVGDADVPFTIQSVSKPFVFALMCHRLGHDRVQELIGVNATGKAFNSVVAVEESLDGRTNPMANSGAIATTSLTPGETLEEKCSFISRGLFAFAGRELTVNEATFESEMAVNYRNRGIAHLLSSRDRIFCDPLEAVHLYTRQCSIEVTAHDLAVMGATLAHGGVNPMSGERVVDPDVCRDTLAVMSISGLYETSGDWLYSIGLPGKSGIGGGIVTVSPGKGAIGAFAPRLDRAGNSVKAQLVTRYLSKRLGLDLFVSNPVRGQD